MASRHGHSFDALSRHLSPNTISALSAQNSIRLSDGVWLRHAPRLDVLKQARLAPTAVRPFRDSEVLEADVPPGLLLRLRVPQLTKLALVGFPLTALDVPSVRYARETRGTKNPFEDVDLRTCVAAERAIQLFAEIVDNMQGSAEILE